MRVMTVHHGGKISDQSTISRLIGLAIEYLYPPDFCPLFAPELLPPNSSARLQVVGPMWLLTAIGPVHGQQSEASAGRAGSTTDGRFHLRIGTAQDVHRRKGQGLSDPLRE